MFRLFEKHVLFLFVTLFCFQTSVLAKFRGSPRSHLGQKFAATANDIPPSNISFIRIDRSGVNDNDGSATMTVSVFIDNVVEPGTTIHCSAYTTVSGVETQPSSAFDVVRTGSSLLVDPASPLSTITVTGLYAATKYSLYCAVESPSGAISGLSSVLASKLAIETVCCKIMWIDILKLSFPENNYASDVLRITLSSPPQYEMKITMDTIPQTNTSFTGSKGYFYPREVTAVPTQAVTTDYVFDYIAGDMGYQKLNITARTLGISDEYTWVYRYGTQFYASYRTEVPNVPVLSSAKFSDDGTYLIVAFDSATDQAGYENVFTCSDFLSFVGMSKAICQWVSNTEIWITPSTSDKNTLIVESTPIELLATNGVRAECYTGNYTECALWDRVVAKTVYVELPLNPSAPTVTISAPSQLGGCGVYTLDLSNSVGSAGREWRSVTISVSDQDPQYPATALQNFFLNNYTLSPPTPAPNSVLELGRTYIIAVEMCNFLGACGTLDTSFSVADNTNIYPSVSILGESYRTITRGTALALSGSAYTRTCAGETRTLGLTYSWTVYQVDSSDQLLNMPSTSQNAAIFRQPAYKLDVGKTYRIVLTVLYEGNSATATTYLYVKQSNIVAVVDGNAAVSWKMESYNALSAANSYDLDQPNAFGTDAGLSFSWSCIQTIPILPTCGLTILPTSKPSLLNITSTIAAVNTTNRVQVTVTDGSRVSTASVLIKIIATAQSQLAIKSNLALGVPVNTGSSLRLTGSLELVKPCTAVWSRGDGSTLVGKTLTVTSKSYQIGQWSYDLLLKSNVLPQRSTVTFKLTCGSQTTSLSLVTNGAPLPGALLVSPTTGDELTTLFTLVASKWTDADIPITYQFGFISTSSLADLVIISSSELSYGTAVLPAGPQSSNYGVNCTLAVSDVYKASVSVRTAVTVNVIDTAQQADSIDNLLDQTTGSVDETKKVIATAGSLLNNVNCSLNFECASLNRMSCLKTSFTCSECMDGYVGDVGDKNTPCVSEADASLMTYGYSCIQGSNDCGNAWFTCNSSNLCDFAQKNCPNDCSGENGQCYFLDINTGTVVEDCSVMSSTCESLCDCFNDYSGIACEISIADLKTKQRLRRALIGSLSNVTDVDDISTTAITSWATFLSVVSQNPYEVSATDSSVAQELALKIVEAAKTQSFNDVNDLVGVLQSMNAMFSVAESNYNPSDLNSGIVTAFNNFTAGSILKIVGAYADMVGKGMVVGQNSTDYIYDNFRMSTFTSAISSADSGASSINLTTPLNSIEQSQNSNAGSWVSIGASSVTNTESSIAASIIVTKGKAYAFDESVLLSNPITLDLSSSIGDIDVNHITFELPAIKGLPQANYSNVSHVFRCTSEEDEFSYNCPDRTAAYEWNCVGKASGSYTVYCPVTISEVACARLNATNGEVDTNLACTTEVVNGVTICNCPIPQGRRRLIDAESGATVLDATGVTNMVASSRDIGVAFADTFDASGVLFSEDGIKKAWVILVLFCVLWGGGAFIFFALMYREQKNKSTEISPEDEIREHPQGSAQLQFLQIYMHRLFPKVYGPGMVWKRLMEEVASHQRYLQFFNTDKAVNYRRRASLFAQLMTLQGMLIFLLAVLYDIQAPTDDGTCATYKSAKRCKQDNTVLDYSQDKCQWKGTGTEAACYYRQAEFNVKVLFYSLIISVVFTAMAEVPIGWLFVIINAPKATEMRAGVALDVTQSARRTSVVDVITPTSAGAHKISVESSGKANSPRSLKAAMTRAVSSKNLSVVPREIPSSVLTAHSDVELLRPRMKAALDLRMTSRRNLLMELGRGRFVDGEDVDPEDAAPPMHPALAKAKGSAIRPAETSAVVDSLDVKRGGDSAAVVLKKLMRELLQQRGKLATDEQRNEFDDVWKVNHGEGGSLPSVVSIQGSNKYALLPVDPEAYRAIGRDMIISEQRADDLCRQMENFTKQQVGLAIMMHFFLDMLGRDTVEAKVFRNKLDEDFELIEPVHLFSKVVASLCICALNIFFVIFCMLKGVQQGQAWQESFCIAALLQLVLEILFFATLETVWLDFILPSLVSPKVEKMQEELSKSFNQNFVNGAEHDLVSADATPYLFISTKMAKRYPELVESIFVQSFQTYLPWGLASRWTCADTEATGSRIKEKTNRSWFSLLCAMISSSTVTLIILQLFGAVPYEYQRTLIKLISPIIFSAWLLIVLAVQDSPFLLACFVMLCLSIMLIVARRLARDRRGEKPGSVTEPLQLELPSHFVVPADAADISRTDGNIAPKECESDEYEEVEVLEEVEVDASDTDEETAKADGDAMNGSSGSEEEEEDSDFGSFDISSEDEE